MKVETRLFMILCAFFAVVTVVYAAWTQLKEPVGVVALVLTTLMTALVSWYLHITSKHYQDRPDDNPQGEIADAEGDYGFFTPHSWWPLWLGLSAAICFAGLAVGWWLFMIGVVIGPVALVGWTFEHYKGDYAN
ncbi:MAG: cytochrome c oxidase subunit 4 [Dermatophilaceae bacterium]